MREHSVIDTLNRVHSIQFDSRADDVSDARWQHSARAFAGRVGEKPIAFLQRGDAVESQPKKAKHGGAHKACSV
jgi:hypothetical protein